MLVLRTKMGLTQVELAQSLGVSRRAVGAWEAGSSYPKIEQLKKLVVLGIEQHAFSTGHEVEEVQTLWHTSHQKVPLDEAWLTGLLEQPLDQSTAPHSSSVGMELPKPRSHVDWGDAPEVSNFYGRENERAFLTEWLLVEHCRVVALLGLGGIGKTSLALTLAQAISSHFDAVFFRSLRNAPLLSPVLDDLIRAVSGQEATLPDTVPDKIELLVEGLRQRRCLVVLDNLETIMQAGTRAGDFRANYTDYGRLVQRLGESAHQSCLLLTSREKPAELGPLEGRHSPVRTLALHGLDERACYAVLEDRELSGAEVNWARLVRMYGGNPLALKLVSEPIREIFGGDIAAFLQEGDAFFNGVGQLLDVQFARSTPLEQALLLWLAIARDPTPLDALLTDLAGPAGRREGLQALESLRRRYLIERAEGRPAFTLQPVILEYMTDQLVVAVHHELVAGQPKLLCSHALVQATAKEYVRRSQEQLIARPLLERWVGVYGAAAGLERQLLRLLAAWRKQPRSEQGYGPGNVINLLRLLRGELRGLDLARLAIRQAYLAEVDAQDARLVDAELADTVLAEAFHFPSSVALSADGALLAAGTSTGQVLLWRVADRTLLWAVQAHTGSVWGMALSGDGQLLASGGEDGMVRLWETGTGRPLASLSGPTGGVWGVALSANGQLLASGGGDGMVWMWEASSGHLLTTLSGHTGAVWCVALSAEGQLLASGGGDGMVRLWEASSGRALATLSGHTGSVWGVALSGDGQLLASGGLDGMVRLWEASGGRALATLSGHTGGVRDVALSGDGQLLASSGLDGMVRLWEASSGRALATFSGHTGGVQGVALSADGQLVASGGHDGTVRLWEASSERPLATLSGHTDGVQGVALSADGLLLASGGRDGMVRLWEAGSGQPLATLSGHTGGVWGVALSADGQLLASSGLDGMVRLWEASSGRPLATLPGHTGWVRGVTLSADGQLLASGGGDGTMRLWAASSGRLLATFSGHTGGVQSVALSADGQLLASGGDDRTVRLWETSSGLPLATLSGHTGVVWRVALSANGQLVASASLDGTVRLWEASSGLPLGTLSGHTGGVRGVALSADGQLLASGGEDGTVRLWEAGSGRPLVTLSSHTDRVVGVMLSADGQLLASASLDGTVKLWEAKSGAWLRTLRAERRYERMDITGLLGVTAAQRASLIALGAVERALDQA